jgi:F420-dependent methylenetetrahydromethanopterin dehydrogenase
MLERAANLMEEARQLREDHEAVVREAESVMVEILRKRAASERRFRKISN